MNLEAIEDRWPNAAAGHGDVGALVAEVRSLRSELAVLREQRDAAIKMCSGPTAAVSGDYVVWASAVRAALGEEPRP